MASLSTLTGSLAVCDIVQTFPSQVTNTWYYMTTTGNGVIPIWTLDTNMWLIANNTLPNPIVLVNNNMVFQITNSDPMFPMTVTICVTFTLYNPSGGANNDVISLLLYRCNLQNPQIRLGVLPGSGSITHPANIGQPWSGSINATTTFQLNSNVPSVVIQPIYFTDYYTYQLLAINGSNSYPYTSAAITITS
jgi:hypothetical protein